MVLSLQRKHQLLEWNESRILSTREKYIAEITTSSSLFQKGFVLGSYLVFLSEIDVAIITDLMPNWMCF
jgi:hypothetical protein